MNTIPDAKAHPTTLATLTMLRDLLLTDESTAVLLLTHNVSSVKPEVQQIPNITTQAYGIFRYLGTLGLINATLRCAGADEIGAVMDAENKLTGFAAVEKTIFAAAG